MWLIIHARIKVNPCQWRGPLCPIGGKLLYTSWPILTQFSGTYAVRNWTKSLTTDHWLPLIHVTWVTAKIAGPLLCIQKHSRYELSWAVEFPCNPLVVRRFGRNFKSLIFEHILRIQFISICCEIALRWMTHNTFDDKSTRLMIYQHWLV